MSLILKQEPANTIATPPAGKSTLFINDNSVMSVKTPAGTVTTFPTVQGANTQIFFNDDSAINGSANLTFTKTTNTLTVTNGNVVATGVKTDNLYYANGSPWDLQQPAGSTGQIQYNNNDSFGASANLTFDGSNFSVTGNAYVSGNLTVDGNVVYVNVENLSVEDPLISLGGGPNGNALTSNNGYDRGLILHNYTTQAVDAFMGWDTSNAEFSFASNASVSGEVVTINTLGNIRANKIAGTISTAAQPNITSVGTLTGLLIGATAAQVDFPNAKAIVSQDNSGQTHSENIGVVGEAVADSGNASTWGIGVLGEARANGATKATGVQGGGYVTNSTDTGAAVGVRGYSIQTHSGGYNIGVLGNASGSGLGSYAFYVQAGNIGSIETATGWDLVDNSPAALTFQSTGKANIFGIETTDGAEGIYTQGYLNVTGNATVGGLKTNNLYYANGSPWDLQLPGGSNTQIQFNDANDFGGSSAFTFNKTSNTVQIGGILSVVGNANIGNIGTGGLFTATGNVTGGNLVTAGAVSATGNGTFGNISTGGLVTATGNITGGNLKTGGIVSATGNGTFGNISTGVANVVDLNVSGNVTSALLPNANVTYDLGSSTQRWKDIYLANSTIYLGNATMSANANTISMSGNVVSANLSTTGALSVTGNANVGNLGTAGVFATTLSSTGNANVGNLGTAGLITATGNLNAGNIITGGVVSATGNITGGNVIGTLLTGTLSTAAQPNVTSVGTLTSVSVSGNANVGNIGAAAGVFTTVAGSLTTASQPNITSVGTLTSVSVAGNANIGNIGTGGLITATGNLNAGNIITGGIVSATGNGTFGNVSATTFTGALSGAATTAGTVTTAAQPNITSVGTLTSLGVNGTVTAVAFTANTGVFTGNGSGLTAIAGANVTGTVATATTAGTVTTAAQGNITSVGTLTGVSVSGNANIGNLGISGVIITTGNSTAGNYITAGNVSATGNGTFGNVSATTFTGALSGAATTAGTVTTAAQPNITSVGTLTSVSVSGNANVGNLGTGGLITATGNLNAGNIITGGILSATGNATVGNISATNHTGTTVSVTGNVTGGNLTTAGILSVTGTGVSSISGNLNMNSKFVVSVSDPVNLQDVATKNYVDTKVTSGISYHQPVAVATTTTLAVATGGTTAYNSPNGAANGIGAYISTTGTFLNIDSSNVQTLGTRILVKDEANATWNGVYTYANTTAIVRSTDTDQYGADSVEEFSINDYFYTQGGTVNKGIAYVVSAPTGTITFGTSNITFSVFSSSQVYSAGTGIAITGTVISANASQTQITAVGTLTTLSVSGNANVGNIGATTFVGALSGAATTAGTVTTAAQPNITSVGTLTSLGVNGTVTAVAFTANTGVFTGNGNGLSSIVGANVTGTVSAATTAGTVTTAAQGNITSVGTLTSLGVSGAVTASTLVSNVATGTAPLTVTSTTRVANLNVAYANVSDYSAVSTATTGNYYINFVNALTGNVQEYANSVFVANVSNGAITATTFVGALSGAATSATTAGTVTTAAQPNITSVGTLSALSVTATITGSVSGTAATITTAAQPNITSVGTLTSLNSSGTITAPAFTANTGVFTGNGNGLSSIVGANVTGTVSSATTAGTVTTAAQGNITSVGTLTSVSVSGNATVGNISATNHTGTTANITGQYISTLATGTAPLVVSSTTQVANLNAATAGLATFATTANAVAGANVSGAVSFATTANAVAGANVSGAVSFATTANAVAGANVSGTVSSATSATTAGTVTTAAQPNITSVGTLSALSVTATITGSVSGSAGTAGTVTTAAQPNITSVSSSFTSLTFANAQTLTANNFTLSTGANTNAGTITGTWTLSAGSKLNATYADLAEKYVADADYEPGTVVLFGGDHEVTLSTEENSFRVAGVVTTNPAYVMNNGCEGEHVATLALQGRVPVKVKGPIYKGDLLVSSADGHATANNMARAGTIIGKSLENFTEASGVIEVAVGRF